MDAINGQPQTVDLDLSDDEFNGIFGNTCETENDGEPKNPNAEEDDGASPIYEKQLLDITVRNLLQKIEKACEEVLEDTESDAFNVIKSLVDASPLENLQATFNDNSLVTLINHCAHTENKISQASFVHILTLIHTRLKFERFD